MFSITLIFVDRCVQLEDVSDVIKYFRTIRNVLHDVVQYCTTKTIEIPLNFPECPFTSCEFFGLLDSCHKMIIPVDMKMKCEYLDCVIPIGVRREKICDRAIRNGDVELLQLAYNSGCELSDDLCTTAIIQNKPECLKYLLENKCPTKEHEHSGSICELAKQLKRCECLKIAKDFGFLETNCSRNYVTLENYESFFTI